MHQPPYNPQPLFTILPLLLFYPKPKPNLISK
jgi:hypothetical protein